MILMNFTYSERFGDIIWKQDAYVIYVYIYVPFLPYYLRVNARRRRYVQNIVCVCVGDAAEILFPHSSEYIE
jgi:hypothetical protein